MSIGGVDLDEWIKDMQQEQRDALTRLQDLSAAFGEFAIANTKAAVDLHERNVSVAVEHVRRSTDAVMKTAGIPEDVRNSVAAITDNFQRVLLSAALVHPDEVKKVAEVGLKTIDKIGQSMRKTG